MLPKCGHTNLRQYDNGGTYGKNYFHWNFEKSSTPVAFSSVPDDIASRESGNTASGFGKIFLHSGKHTQGDFFLILNKVYCHHPLSTGICINLSIY